MPVRFRYLPLLLASLLGLTSVCTADEASDAYRDRIHPLLKRFCLDCHSTKEKEGELDLEQFQSFDLLRKKPKIWQKVLEQVDAGEMPPKDKPQPTADERRALAMWVSGFLDREARARAGDPGRVPMRRLSNVEYSNTVRDLCGVDLQPTREFPADGAAGEGFTNAAEALGMSPSLLAKYLNASKEIAARAVLLPDGFRFSPDKSRQDWADESLANLKEFYKRYQPDGRLPLQPYLAALIRHRDDLTSGKVKLEDVAAQDKLHPKYLRILWTTLNTRDDSFPLKSIRESFQKAGPNDVNSLTATIGVWQTALWQLGKIGSYNENRLERQLPNGPTIVASQTLKFGMKPEPGQRETVLYLSAREFSSSNGKGRVIWQQPRLQRANQPPLLLRDYAQFGSAYEVDYSGSLASTAKYLAAAQGDAPSVETIAQRDQLDDKLLQRWCELLDLAAFQAAANLPKSWQPVGPLELLDEQTPPRPNQPAITGWRPKGRDLPVVVSNNSDKVELVPGRMSPHRLAVHPMPEQFVALAWKSPIAGKVRMVAEIEHVHPACGNGVAWRLEQRRGEKAFVVAEGNIDLGKKTLVERDVADVQSGDVLLTVIEARDASHVCDMTEVSIAITDLAPRGRKWDLATDTAASIVAGNPHADSFGNKDVWSFVLGSAKPGEKNTSVALIPADSLLGKWRAAAIDPARREEAAQLAEQVQSLLAGARPKEEKHPDRVLYDNFVAPSSRLFQGLDLSHLTKKPADAKPFGLAKERFSDADLHASSDEVIEIRLPTTLLLEHEFLVDARPEGDGGESLMQFHVSTSPPSPDATWDGKSPFVALPQGKGAERLAAGFQEFRRVFPMFICFPQVIPVDEVVCLKQFHREDEPLLRLFLDDAEAKRIDHLWSEHRFISRFPVTENQYLPQFIGFVTQDQPKKMLDFFEGQREPFRKRAEQFEAEEKAAEPAQLDALMKFAARAYRRPLSPSDADELRTLYAELRKRELPHDEAFRGVLSRVFMSSSFLLHRETPPAGKDAAPVNEWELASRLSYFLWSSLPDDELRSLAEAGRLHNPEVLAEQTTRMMHDPRVRSLAIEFGTQMIHVRGFDSHAEKSERLFPMFDAPLRAAINEESIRFFEELFRNNRPVTDLLDADYTFLNESLAKHYGIPNVAGPEWRRIDGVKKVGRGGILGLASVQTVQSGASRTSPVLRGNWVVETLLGEKLPRPPADVPRLPEEETGNDGLTMRQRVERHVRAPECNICHQRIDPFGFALEKYDPIGRLRTKDLAGQALDSQVKLRDGTEFEGIDGLRNYLLTTKKEVFTRLFCKRLLGYALGRTVALSDEPLLDEIMAGLKRGDGGTSVVVQAIVRSPQFHSIRGADFPDEE